MGNMIDSISSMKPFDELVFSDDFMFGKTMEDSELCHDVIECLLQRPIGPLQEVQDQKEFRFTSDGKSIRLDIYNRGIDGTVYDAEMQNLNRKTIKSLALPRRSRFYQSSIDMDFLKKGGHYKDLPDSNILFICTFDPFGIGLPQYTFTARCKEKMDVVLNDGVERHFYNCMYCDDDLPTELGKFYEYIRTGRVDSKLTERIENAVIKGRKNEIWRSSYMKERAIIMDLLEEERAEYRESLLRLEEERDRAEEQVKRMKEYMKSKGIDYSEAQL